MCSGTMRVITPTSAGDGARGHLAHLGDADLQHGHLLRRRQAQEGDTVPLVVEVAGGARLPARRRRRSPAAPWRWSCPPPPATARTRARCPRRHQAGDLRRSQAARPATAGDAPSPPAPRQGPAGAGSPARRRPPRDRRQEVLRDAGDEGRPGPVGEGAGDEVVPVARATWATNNPPGRIGGSPSGSEDMVTAPNGAPPRCSGGAQPRLPPSARPGGGPGRRRRGGKPGWWLPAASAIA